MGKNINCEYIVADEEFFGNKDIVDKILNRTPVRRLGTVEDCANMVVFLAPNKSDFIQGEAIAVDGGLTILQF